MNLFKFFKWIVLSIAILIASIQSSFSYQWVKNYSHVSVNEPLELLLTDFARSQNLVLTSSPLIQGKVNGNFKDLNPNLFLKGIYAAYGVKYYIIDNRIYFYHESESVSTLFKPSSVEPYSLINMLQASKLISNDLPLTVDENGLIVIQGPQEYVDNVLLVGKEFDYGQENQIVMEVFKLQHAKAEDLQISSYDKTVIIPGVASILQKMVLGVGAPTGNSMSVTTHKASVDSLRGKGLSSVGQDTQNNLDTKSQKSVASNGSNAEEGTVSFNPNIIADSRLNAVVIQDLKYRMPYYKRVISELDVPTRLVELHAAIVDIDVDATKDLGIDWRAGRSSGNWAGEIGQGSMNWDGSFPVEGGSGGIFSTIFKTNHSSFMMQVNALEEDNKANTLGKPSVLTLDNVEATLEDTTTRYIPVRGYESSDLFKVESGTVLRVTPHIIDREDGQDPLIQMVISLQANQENTADSLSVSEDGEVIVPPIKQTRINTQAVVQQGQSLLLGGYYVQYEGDKDSGIPILKDIPFAGALFGSSGDSTYTRERLLLITPKILNLDAMNDLPDSLNNENFKRDATAATYQSRPAKAPESSGCSSNRVANSESAVNTNNLSTATLKVN